MVNDIYALNEDHNCELPRMVERAFQKSKFEVGGPAKPMENWPISQDGLDDRQHVPNFRQVWVPKEVLHGLRDLN